MRMGGEGDGVRCGSHSNRRISLGFGKYEYNAKLYKKLIISNTYIYPQYDLKPAQASAGPASSLNYGLAQPKIWSSPHNLPMAKQW